MEGSISMHSSIHFHLFSFPGTESILSATDRPKMAKNRYSKTCLKRLLKKDRKLVFKTDYRLMQVKSIAECSKSILQYF